MRLPLLLIAAVMSLACRDTTRPDYTNYPPRYSLLAYTIPVFDPSRPDSIQCEIFATWSSTDSLVVPWTGTVSVVASRVKRGDRLFTGGVRRGTATLSIADGPGDSVRVTLAGAVNLSLEGRMNASSEATGQWTCSADASFGTRAPGEANGSWYLRREYPID